MLDKKVVKCSVCHDYLDLLTFHCCRFLIGREKDGMESEVARLINESLEKEKLTEMVFF